jgi:hypothetical protein
VNILPLFPFLESLGLTALLEENSVQADFWNIPSLPVVERECIVCVDLNDERSWEKIRDPVTDNTLILDVNGVHFYRQVQAGIYADQQPAETHPRLVAFVGEDHRREYMPTLQGLYQDYQNVTPGSLNAPELLSTIRHRQGMDALLLIAHGDTDGRIRFRRDATESLTVEALKEALMSNPRPLRFAYFMLCDLHRPLLTMLGELAQAGKLHPQFGGLVMYGSPRQDFGVLFTKKLLTELLTNPDQQYPLLRAVRAARQLAADQAGLQDALRPIVVACHPQANPLPNRLGQELETYLRRLGDPDTAL